MAERARSDALVTQRNFVRNGFLRGAVTMKLSRHNPHDGIPAQQYAIRQKIR